ncbi:enoyl-CoA hydratase/isomerase family protein [Micromonospora orduensis]|nr:enoyl-CoA hydratase/isomerase family protein [Micromonospora orduensis]
MRDHGDDVHATLTEDGRLPMRLDALLDAAAVRFPGLVPDRAALAAERSAPQRAKEGWEVDQGIFAWGLLRSTRAGTAVITDMLRPTVTAERLLSEFRGADRLDLGTVTIERHGPAAHVTLANGAVLNAEDDSLVADLETAVDLALLDDRIAVGVLRGGVVSHPKHRGRRIFCAGINLTHLYEGKISFADFLLRRELGPLNKIMRGIETGSPAGLGDLGGRREKPWIAVVDGFAIGGGMQMLLVVDHVIADEGVYFSLPAVREGIVPGVANLRLSRRLGPRAARQVLLGGRRIDAAEDVARQICDQVVPAEAIDQAVDRAVDGLQSSAVVANRRMLHLSEEPLDRFRDYLAAFSIEQAQRLYHDDVLDTIERHWIKRNEAST